MASCVIGSLSFAGSMVAFAKLQELMPGRPLTYRLQSAVNGLILLVILGLAVYLIVGDQNLTLFVDLHRAVAPRSACCSSCRSAARTCR